MALVFTGFENSVTRICTITELVPPQAMTKPSVHHRKEGGLASKIPVPSIVLLPSLFFALSQDSRESPRVDIEVDIHYSTLRGHNDS